MRKGTVTRKKSAGEIVVCVSRGLFSTTIIAEKIPWVRCVAVALFPCPSSFPRNFSFSSLCDVFVLRFQCRVQMNVVDGDSWCVLMCACVWGGFLCV